MCGGHFFHSPACVKNVVPGRVRIGGIGPHDSRAPIQEPVLQSCCISILSRILYKHKFSNISAHYQKLINQSYNFVPVKGFVVGVEDRTGRVGEVDGEAAAAVEGEVEEGGGFVVARDCGGEGRIEAREFVGGGAELGRQVAQVVEESERRGAVEVALNRPM